MIGPHNCDRCGETYDEAKGDGYCGLCPSCADATEPNICPTCDAGDPTNVVTECSCSDGDREPGDPLTDECSHKINEDCMSCVSCGACREDVDEEDMCTDCVQAGIDAMQAGIDSGQVWLMEGAAGREAMRYIEAGLCTLGEVGHNDYYGNWVPSRTEVKPGTKGSPEYAEKMQDNV